MSLVNLFVNNSSFDDYMNLYSLKWLRKSLNLILVDQYLNRKQG